MARDSMVFYRSFYEAMNELDAEDFKAAVMSILAYAMDDIEPEITGTARAMFLMAKPQIDANNKRYQNGCKGGKPITKVKPNCNQTVTKVEPNENENVNDNENDIKEKNIKKKSSSFSPPTLDEVKQYIQEQGYTVNADNFIDYYSSNGWYVGKNKMKDWKATVRRWARSDAKEQRSGVRQVNKAKNFNERQYDYSAMADELLGKRG